ncbi:MAG: alpha/beta hydrolase family protein [Limisphaerales bacterium]
MRLFTLFVGLISVTVYAAEPAPWNYDEYRKSHPEQVCTIRTSQSGKTNYEPSLKFRIEGEEAPKNNAALRTQILEAWRDLLGPSSRNTGPLNARVLEVKEFPKFTRKKIEYIGDPGEPIHAWLFIPKTTTPSFVRLSSPKNESGQTHKFPAILCLHQTVRSGKGQTAGVDELKPELEYGPLLAERGFVTLCPDAICFGERYQVGGKFYCHYGDAVRIYQGNAGRSILSKMVDDTMRAVDYLQSLPEVNGSRIGCIGHSHGGYGTLFAMAFDPRLKAGVVSCGFTTFRWDPTPARWFRNTALIPRLGGFENHMQDTPIDFHQLFAAISPRPLFISAALQDSIFPHLGDTEWIRKDVKTVYDRANGADNFQLFTFEGGHGFVPEARDRAWAFFDQHLK